MNVNEASQEELEALPGVGPATAEKLMKARPIADGKELEGIIPPSAWLKIQEEGVEFAYGGPAENDNQGPQPEGDARIAAGPAPQFPVTAAEPVIKMRGPQPMVLKRLLPGQRLRAGAEHICLWNMRFGPQNEAWIPEDAAREVATEEWFNNEVRNKVGSMAIKFAHWGPSVQIQSIPGLGLVNLLLFEIIKEEGDEDGNGSGIEKGGD